MPSTSPTTYSMCICNSFLLLTRAASRAPVVCSVIRLTKDALRPRSDAGRGDEADEMTQFAQGHITGKQPRGRTARRDTASLLAKTNRRVSKLRDGSSRLTRRRAELAEATDALSTSLPRTMRRTRSFLLVRRKRRSTPAVRPVPSDRSDQLRPSGGFPAGEGPTSNFNRRTEPGTEALASTPSIRPALVAKDQRQTPHRQHSLLGEARATGITHPGFYGRKPWRKPNSALIITRPKPRCEDFRRLLAKSVHKSSQDMSLSNLPTAAARIGASIHAIPAAEAPSF